MSKRLFSFVVIGASICSITSNVALAKTVELRWSQVKGATQYEVEITKNGKTVIQEKLAQTQYQANLDPGSYSHRFRGIDSFGRGGRWSVTKELVVTAPAPLVDLKAIPEKMEFTGSFPGLPLKWKKVDGAASYEVSLKNKVTGETVYKKETQSNKLNVEALKSGDFEISITSIIDLKGKKFASKNPVTKSIFISEKKMEQPENLFPNGNVLIADDPRVRLEWKEVKGAIKYEVTLEPIEGRKIATQSRSRSWIVDKNEIEVPVTKNTLQYRWKVRALASGGEMSDQSVAEFFPRKDTSLGGGSGSIKVGGTNTQFSGRVENPSGGGGSAVGMGWGTNVRGDYWFGRQLGIEALYERNWFNHQTGSFAFNHFGIMAKTRWRFKETPTAWTFNFKLGPSIAEFAGSGPGDALSPTFGVLTELSAVKPLSDEYDLELGVLHYLPTEATNGANLVRFFENGILRPYAEISHTLSKNVSASLGVRYDLRQIHTGSGSSPDRFFGGSAGVDVSIKYKFGNINEFKISEMLSEGTRKIANLDVTAGTTEIASDPLKANHGVLEIAGGIMPFDTATTTTSPLTAPETTSTGGVSYRNGVRMEYWPWRYSGLSFDFESSYYLIGNSDKTAMEVGLAYNRRFYLNKFLGGSILIGKIGAAQKSWLQLISGGTVTVLTGLGPTAEIELRKLWNKTMISVLFQYQYPSIGLARIKAFHPIYKGLELGLEGFWESQIASVSSTTTISRMNTGLLGVFRYRFGVTY